MTNTIKRDARAVFLPAFDGLNFHPVMDPFLSEGGCSVLIGESRSEYVGRRMSKERLAGETAEMLSGAIDKLKVSTSNLIVAVDEELAGIRRLEAFVPPLPTLAIAKSLSDHALEQLCFETAQGARKLGVNMFLAPIADIVDGTNPWLAGRTMGLDKAEVARLVAAFVRGVQRAGVTAVTKHFPGFNNLALDPALADVSLGTSIDDIIKNAGPFRSAIAAGTEAVMAGPAAVAAIDAENAACTSEKVIALLRGEFGFKGLIVSDDLDAPATMRERTLLGASIASLNAGVDLLLVAGGPHLGELCNGLVDAVTSGALSAERLADAASRVRALAAAH